MPMPLAKRCGSGEASTSMPKAGAVPVAGARAAATDWGGDAGVRSTVRTYGSHIEMNNWRNNAARQKHWLASSGRLK